MPLALCCNLVHCVVVSPATSGLVDTARADDTVLENDTHISELGASYDSDVPVFLKKNTNDFKLD